MQSHLTRARSLSKPQNRSFCRVRDSLRHYQLIQFNFKHILSPTRATESFLTLEQCAVIDRAYAKSEQGESVVQQVAYNYHCCTNYYWIRNINDRLWPLFCVA